MKTYRDAGYGGRESSNARWSTRFATGIDTYSHIIRKDSYHDFFVKMADNVQIDLAR